MNSVFFRELPRKRLSTLIALLCALAAGLWLAACSRSNVADDEFIRMMNLGKSHYEGGDAEKAIAAYQKAIELQPTHIDARLNLANAYLLGNQPDNAIQQAQEALNLDQNLAAAYYVQGCALLRQNKFEDALKALQPAKDIDKTINAVSFQLGRAHQALNHFEDAIREFQEVTQFEPEHPAAHYNLSQALIRVGRKDEANVELEKHKEIAAKKSQAVTDAATYERCEYTKARVPFALEEPEKNGIKVSFADMTDAAFGAAAKNYHGPVGVLDINRRGQNDLFVADGSDGFRLLINSNANFQPRGERVPGVPGAKYSRCLVGDLNQDRYEDVVMLGDKAVHLFKFATNGGITEATAFAGLKDLKATDGALVDLDFTGKLDLLLVTPTEKKIQVWRNLGNMYFRDVTATSGVPATMSGVAQIAVDDWNNDDLMDVFVARDGQVPQVLVKQRGGSLAPTNSSATWPAGSRVAVSDLNNDLRNDLVIASAGKLECAFGGLTNQTAIPLGDFVVNSLALVDYDNDGWLDIFACGNGLRAWRNVGRSGFREVTSELGLDKLIKGRVESVTAADFDQDGDTDLLVCLEQGGLQLLRNDGGNANLQLKLRLFGNRSNPSGLGVRLEALAGHWRTGRTVTQLPVEIGVGKHAQLDSINVRWVDLAMPVVDFKVDPRATMTLVELILPTGSCPYLYVWDGNQFRFVTDILGAAPLGLPAAEGKYIEPDTEEFVWIGNDENFKPRDGKFVLQITEELREVLYLDEAKLFVVDHPQGTEVHPTCKLVPGRPFPPKEIRTLGNRKTLRHAERLDGVDVTAELAENDGKLVSPLKLRVPQLRGLAEPHGVVLDFGALEVERPLTLALTGWLRFGGGMANIAASQNPELPFPFPQLEVEIENGKWKPVDVVVGAPAGKTKTILVELAGKLPPHSRRLRLTTAFEIHWDRIALFETLDANATQIASLATQASDLHWRGFSEFEQLPWFAPLTPIYGTTFQKPNWRITPTGWCTRYGEVNELIQQRDNKLALVSGGDELTLMFSVGAVAPKDTQNLRDYFLFVSGSDKDADFHVEQGWAVEPLPLRRDASSAQTISHASLRSAQKQSHSEILNSRWVGQRTLRRTVAEEK